MLKPLVELLNAWVLSEPQYVATIDPGEAPGTGDDQEAEGPDALQQVRVGPFARAGIRLGASVELEVPEQIMSEHAELLPGAVGAVVVGGDHIEAELALQFRQCLLLRAASAHEGEERGQAEAHVGGDG